MTEQLPVIAPTSEEVGEVLTHCGEAALLVGGQALAFWALRFEIKPVGKLAAAVTVDIDFIGSAKVAVSLARSLGWRLTVLTRENPTNQVAQLTKIIPGVGVKQIDFLNAILGLQTKRVEQRAVKVTFPNGARIRVLHPLDVLESRLRNILLLQAKKSAAGVAQVALAISVTASFFRSVIEEGVDKRVIHDAIERVAKLALNRRLAKICVDNDLNLLLAVPSAAVSGTQRQSGRWQQIAAAEAKIKSRILDRGERRR
jgi:hypothetical protein